MWWYTEVGEASVKRVRVDPHSRQAQWNNSNLGQLPLLPDVKRHFLIFPWLFCNDGLEIWVNGMGMSVNAYSLLALSNSVMSGRFKRTVLSVNRE